MSEPPIESRPTAVPLEPAGRRRITVIVPSPQTVAALDEIARQEPDAGPVSLPRGAAGAVVLAGAGVAGWAALAAFAEGIAALAILAIGIGTGIGVTRGGRGAAFQKLALYVCAAALAAGFYVTFGIETGQWTHWPAFVSALRERLFSSALLLVLLAVYQAYALPARR